VRFLVEPLLEDLGVLDLRGIHWVIVGGESGQNFQQMESCVGARDTRPVRGGGRAVLLQAVRRAAD